MLRGTGVSPGIAHGEAYVLPCAARAAAPRLGIQVSEVAGELARFETGLAKAEQELRALKEAVGERIGSSQADIFDAQRLVLRDPTLHEQVALLVREGRINLEAALSEVIDRFTRAFDDIPDSYLRERAADVRDVGRRILSALAGPQGALGPTIPDGAIVVTEELLPSMTARLEVNHVRAFVTERGGRFSHAAILARSMRTPAISGVPEASHKIKTGDHLIVDGLSGIVFVNPDRSVRREYERLEAEMSAYKEELRHLVEKPSVTLDGTPVPLLANVGKLSDTEAALLYRADGIGLYRTEFGFSIRCSFPTEDEQHEFLERAAERFHPRPVVFRLLDLGGDKELPYFPLPMARNPLLAPRGIRLLLKHPEVLKPQLRAFLRVSAAHPVSILLPVVAGLEDVFETRKVVRQVASELKGEGKAHDPEVPIGAMIELPSAALIAGALAREADFLSLGTNDLVQYVLAADREDEGESTAYQPLHPAVLSLIGSVVEGARQADKELTICGEMASNPAYTGLLLGLGLRALSVAPGEILDVKSSIREVHLGAARALAAEALQLGTAAEVEAFLEQRRAPPPPAAP
ncbi:MAG TPA: phosphoenolpyruvate--protein phosphotransferase [Anaeromyxobacteraceae bacterium]|nr:phosphoenolpyruvate--protein phosphotransferase [Anaeromyxobacteraceae bacterium]